MNCLHGMKPEWCAICRNDVRAIPQSTSIGANACGVEASQTLVDLLLKINAKLRHTGKLGDYRIDFRSEFASEVAALTSCRVNKVNSHYSNIFSKDAFNKLTTAKGGDFL